MEPATILVVDDEPMVRELLEEYLTDLDYRSTQPSKP
jgi:CheY-like chemotaxis protein